MEAGMFLSSAYVYLETFVREKIMTLNERDRKTWNIQCLAAHKKDKG